MWLIEMFKEFFNCLLELPKDLIIGGLLKLLKFIILLYEEISYPFTLLFLACLILLSAGGYKKANQWIWLVIVLFILSNYNWW